MNLYLMRHGFVSPNNKGEKVLTEEGINYLGNTISFLNSQGINFDYVITSPKERTKQTGMLMSNLMNDISKFFDDAALKPGASVDDILPVIEELNVDNILLIFHEPDVNLFLSELVSKDYINIDVQPGTLICVEFKGMIKKGEGKLKMVLPPLKKSFIE